MTVSYQLITQSQGIAAFVAQVDAALVALGSIGLQDAILTRLEDSGGRPRLRLTLSTTSSGPIGMRAAYFGATSGITAPDVQAAAFFAANPLYRVHAIRDVGDQRRGGLDPNAIMVIYATVPVSNCGQQRARPMIVEALGNILAGASGSCQMVGAAGLVAGGVISVVNRFDTTWLTGTRGYAIVRAGTCIIDGFKTCC